MFEVMEGQWWLLVDETRPLLHLRCRRGSSGYSHPEQKGKHPLLIFIVREEVVTVVVGWFGVMSESTRSYDCSSDWKFSTHKPRDKGIVLHGYGNPITAPITVHTHKRKHMVLPIPESSLIYCKLVDHFTTDSTPGGPHVEPVPVPT